MHIEMLCARVWAVIIDSSIKSLWCRDAKGFGENENSVRNIFVDDMERDCEIIVTMSFIIIVGSHSRLPPFTTADNTDNTYNL